MSENNLWVSRVVAWSGKAALFCLGLFAMLAMVVLAAVLAPVMLTATVIPPARRAGGEVRGTGDTAGTPRSVQRGAALGLPEGTPAAKIWTVDASDRSPSSQTAGADDAR